MPSFTPHLLIPLGLLLATRVVPPRIAFLMLPVTLVPDLDYFIPPHRALTSNLLWPLLLGLAAWRLRHHGNTRWVHAATACFYWGSHVLMDMFAGGVVAFWPFINTNIFIDLSIVVDTATNTPVLVSEAGTSAGPPRVSARYLWFSPIDAAMWVLTLISAGLWWLGRRYGREVMDEAARGG